MSGSEYCRLLIKSLLELGQIPFDVYVKLPSGKILRYCRQYDDIDQLCDYHNRGANHVWVKKNEYEKFMKYSGNGLVQKFFKFNGSTIKENLADSFDNDFDVAIEKLRGFGITRSEVTRAKDLSKKALGRIEKLPELNNELHLFEETSRVSYLNSLLTGVTSNQMLGHFSWQTPSIREKIFFTSMLAHIKMNEEEIALIKSWEKKEIGTEQLPKSLKIKAKQIVDDIKKQVAATYGTEVINILSQCYEMPDGGGFPHGIPAQNMSLLSCIYIVARNFINSMERVQFQPNKKDLVMGELRGRFARGNYRKAVESLQVML